MTMKYIDPATFLLIFFFVLSRKYYILYIIYYILILLLLLLLLSLSFYCHKQISIMILLKARRVNEDFVMIKKKRFRAKGSKIKHPEFDFPLNLFFFNNKENQL